MLIVGNHYLLADAKVLKDILQYHIICHFSCNIGNKENTFAYVLLKEIP